MSSFWSPQTTDLNGLPHRIIFGEIYRRGEETSIQPMQSLVSPMDSAISPPLSDIEIADIEASEREFSAQEVRIYENVENFICELRAARSRFQRESRE